MNTRDSYKKGRKRRERKTNRGAFLSAILLIAIMLAGCANLLTDMEGDTLALDTVPTTVECVTVPPTVEDVKDKPDAIDAAADEVLAKIITDNMSVRQQVCAIYAWARTSIGYGGHSDRTDWRKTAYITLTERRGDCYGYMCVTKLMFQRLGIPNIDVKKVRNFPEDSDHFWSLVSVDGGKTWYHFDATPRVGDGDDFCLVTDAFLDDYSNSHKGSHNRDKSLYPATP